MKSISRIITVFLVMILFLHNAAAVGASEYDGFYTAGVAEDVQSEFLEDFRCLSEPVESAGIHCFDISPRGKIALAVIPEGEASDVAVMVFDSEGVFRYGYQFTNNGSAFTIFFEDEDLTIFWTKSNYIGSFDAEGNCLRFRKVLRANHDLLHELDFRPASGRIGSIRYYTEGGFFLSSVFPRFSIENGDGERILIHDGTHGYRERMLGFGAVFVMFAAVMIMIEIGQKRTVKKNEEE